MVTALVAGMTNKLIRENIGKLVDFHGYDGKTYLATLIGIRRGIVTINYTVNSVDTVTAYVMPYRLTLTRP